MPRKAIDSERDNAGTRSRQANGFQATLRHGVPTRDGDSRIKSALLPHGECGVWGRAPRF